MFDETESPDCGHCQEGGDSPASTPECGSTRAYFAADKAEEGGGDESDEEDEEEDRLEDEDEGSGVPARIEWKEGAKAVVIGPVEE
jgi:hypothetical protein